ncbi:hypothetical protein [Candidatus Magnetomonas plexicatena]|uniref:hypothetical protein n=1 Tax=Candidatus Magnetomonas plexicatena TaxID=2552947 RepID=UPI001C76AF0C|nr:hypothetical protein E2O03_012385 [Nitrospirales bacterium LBB_01]
MKAIGNNFKDVGMTLLEGTGPIVSAIKYVTDIWNSAAHLENWQWKDNPSKMMKEEMQNTSYEVWQAKEKIKATWQAKDIEALKPKVEVNIKDYEASAKILEDKIKAIKESQKSSEIEIKLKFIDMEEGPAKVKAVNEALLANTQSVYKRMQQTVTETNTKEISESLKKADALQDHYTKISATLKEYQAKLKETGNSKLYDTANIEQAVNTTKTAMSDLLSATVKNAAQRHEAIINELNNALQKEQEYAQKVKGYQDELISIKESTQAKINELQRKNMSESSAHSKTTS